MRCGKVQKEDTPPGLYTFRLCEVGSGTKGDFLGLRFVLSASFFVRFFCLPKKKNQKKGQANTIAPRVLPGQRTTIFTTYNLMH
jgi:hypothetical protein